MTQFNEKTLAASLLKADAIAAGTLPENDRAELFRRVALAEKRQVRSRNIMYACWSLLGAWYVATNVFHIVNESTFGTTAWNVLSNLDLMLLWATFFFTVQTIVRLGIVRGKELNARLASIENLLAATLTPRD